MHKTKIVQYRPKEDPTAWEQARKEGKSPFEIVKMTLTLLLVIPMGIALLSGVLGPFAHDPVAGPIACGLGLYGLYKLFALCDEVF